MLTKSDLQSLRALIEELHKTFRNEVVKFKDEILKELVKIRQDYEVMKGYKDQLEDHEERLTKLENISTTTKI